jgi:lipopolysaccharide heptosyltransferase II
MRMRVVVAQTAFLGDVVLSTPVFAAVKRCFPESHLTAWVRPEGASVLAGHPHVDAIVIDDKRGADRGVPGFVRVCRALRAGEFDVALALHKSLRTALLLTLARIPRRIGFRQSRGWFLYHRRVFRDRALHDLDRNLSILSGLNVDPKGGPSQPFVAVTAEAAAKVDQLLEEVGITAATPLIGLAPGSAWATKRWPVAAYAQVGRILRARGYGVMLFGAPSERDIAAAVDQQAGAITVNLAGRTDVATLVAAIDRCQALVCNDSAPMHIAVARRIPVVAIFGPTHPRMGYGPRAENSVVVQRDLSCRPCSRHGGPRCPLGTHACMRDLRPEEVLGALEPFLASTRRQCSGA